MVIRQKSYLDISGSLPQSFSLYKIFLFARKGTIIRHLTSFQATATQHCSKNQQQQPWSTSPPSCSSPPSPWPPSPPRARGRWTSTWRTRVSYNFGLSWIESLISNYNLSPPQLWNKRSSISASLIPGAADRTCSSGGQNCQVNSDCCQGQGPCLPQGYCKGGKKDWLKKRIARSLSSVIVRRVDWNHISGNKKHNSKEPRHYCLFYCVSSTFILESGSAACSMWGRRACLILQFIYIMYCREAKKSGEGRRPKLKECGQTLMRDPRSFRFQNENGLSFTRSGVMFCFNWWRLRPRSHLIQGE